MARWTRHAAWLAATAAGVLGVGGVAMFADVGPNRAVGDRGEVPSFINWETPHVHPIDMTPDGQRLLVVNTGAARLEVYALHSGTPVWVGAVPVGLDPVTVRARGDGEAWVVNHISDSVSIVDLFALSVVRTVSTADEPCDVVFAGNPQRAFVSCSQVNTVQVFDLADLGAAPLSVPIEGEDPRALAVSPDGATVYAAIFESGNGTTILGGGGDTNSSTRLAFPPNVVNDPAGPYGGVNPPPNAGAGFNPPIGPWNLPAPPVGLIVRKNAAGQWMDDNNGDWTDLVSGANAALSGRLPGWDLLDQDVAAINADTLSVGYAKTLMNMCMAIGVNPASGRITVVGTEATNEVRFEPNITGRFIRVNFASVDPADLTDKSIVDLNAHLSYAVSNVPQATRDIAVGDPRAIVWNANGDKGYIAGMGSNNVIVVNAAGVRAGLSDTIPVGEGPTGIVLDENRDQMYVLNRFAGTISIVNLSAETQVDVVPFFDPTPAAIKTGRKHLYDTHLNSGLGHIACASCHIDARMDRLGWDLGDPLGAEGPLGDNNLGFGVPGLEPNTTNPSFEPFHAMKGPMATQTLQNIIGQEPHHWRGDRTGIEAFAAAFTNLQGDDLPLPANDMQEFENFLATIYFPPNPNRNFDNTLPTNMPLPGHFKTGRFGSAGQPLANGNAVTGLSLYRSATRRLDGGALACVTCHTLPTGGGPDVTLAGNTYQQVPIGPMGEHHRALVSVDGSTNISIKIPHLRNMHEKVGFNTTQLLNTAGFGYLHDGSVDSIERFISEPVFTVANDQEVANLTAFMLAFAGSDLPAGSSANIFEPPGGTTQDTHAAVGEQTTLMNAASPQPGQLTLISSMITQANTNKVGLIVKGAARGWAYVGGNNFQSDHTGEVITAASLQTLATPGNELTYTVVPKGSETRLGIDADEDGALDFDEPACDTDFNNDGVFPDIQDLFDLLDVFAGAPCPAGAGVGVCDTIDFNRDGVYPDTTDLTDFLAAFSGGC